MSLSAVRAALETALNAMSPALDCAWENTPYTPISDRPYQRVWLLAAQPDRVEMAGKLSREQGFMQVSLAYPLDAGPGDAGARAKLIRDTFPDAASFIAGGITTHIEGEAEIAPGRVEEDRYVVPVRVRFYAFIPRS